MSFDAGDTEYRALKRDITIEEEDLPLTYVAVKHLYYATLDGNLHPRGPRVKLKREGNTPQEAMADLEKAVEGFGWRLAEV